MRLCPWRCTMKRCKGVTLLELMVCVALLAIITTVALPSFKNFFEDEKQASARGDILTAIATARTEATRRSMPVYLCVKQAGNDQCDATASADWRNGWILCASVDNGASCSSVLLRSSTKEISKLKVTNANGQAAVSTVAFRSNGTVVSAKFNFCSDVSTSYNKSFSINALGNVSDGNADCS